MSPRSKGLLLASLTLIGLGIAAGRPGFQLNAAVLVFFGLAAVFVLSALFGDAWQQYRDRRRARLPTDDELGWFDHGERIEPLWRQRWRLNNRLYVDATWMDRQITAALATISDVHSSVAVETELPHLLDRLAKRLRRRIHVFEEFATTHALTVEALLRGYSKVLERGGSVVVVPGALASFRKRADRQLHQHLEQDLVIWRAILRSARNARGFTYLYSREMDRLGAALEKVIASNEQLLALNNALEPIARPSPVIKP